MALSSVCPCYFILTNRWGTSSRPCFGEPYDPLRCSDEALERFVGPAFAVGVRLEPDGRLDIAAPFGLDDVFALRIRRNPHRPRAKGWAKVTASARERWPELTIVEPVL